MSDNGKMPNGYSSRGGQVINPFNTTKSPMGSSSGSAVAVAAGLCTVALGTETSGSIISPAWQNGVVGIKPTLGLVGRSGIIPICYTFDTAGPITRSVQDSAILLSVISETDPDDVSTHSKRSEAIDYTQYLDENGLNGLRIGICRNLENTEENKIAFDNLLKTISSAGAILEDIDYDFKYTTWNITKSEFQPSINYYLSTLSERNKIKSLRDIIDYNEANAEKALKYGQETFNYVINESPGNLTDTEYIEELIKRDGIISDLDDLFIKNRLDIILTEKNMGIAPYTGFPSMTIPIGQKSDKLPIGSYWIARRYDEASLFRATYAVEQLLNLNLVPELENKME
jgi:amidase